jgi:hypothetical protein
MWSGFIWLGIEFCGGLLPICNARPGSVKGRKFVNHERDSAFQ